MNTEPKTQKVVASIKAEKFRDGLKTLVETFGGSDALKQLVDDLEIQQGWVDAAMAASEPAFAAVWDNDEDAIYDTL